MLLQVYAKSKNVPDALIAFGCNLNAIIGKLHRANKITPSFNSNLNRRIKIKYHKQGSRQCYE